MNFTSFVLVSTFENIAFFYFIMVLFRFNTRENFYKFLLFSIILSFISNTLFTESLAAISPVIIAVIMILFTTILLRVHIFNAMIMVITTYVVNYMVQWMIVGLTLHFTGLTSIAPYTRMAFTMQISSSFLMFLFAQFTRWQKGGFSFINHNSRLKRTKYFSKENRSLIIFFFLSIVAVFMGQFLFYLSKNPPYLAVSIVFADLSARFDLPLCETRWYGEWLKPLHSDLRRLSRK